MKRYAGRVALVTGAGQGLGRAIAERLATEGADLAICDVNPASVHEAADAAASRAGTRAVPSVTDVTSPAQVSEWITCALAEFGRIDVLVSNAGVIRDNRLERMTDDEWQTVINVSLGGTFHCCLPPDIRCPAGQRPGRDSAAHERAEHQARRRCRAGPRPPAAALPRETSGPPGGHTGTT